MRDALAERLLATVMGWSPADVARERPILQALAFIKYDEYQQFSPGMRFVESLALWLEQFEADERSVAYEFVCQRLVFLSEAEMAHFAQVMYPDVVRPVLLDRAAAADGTSAIRVSRIAGSATFERLQMSTLFFGLSDGARIDQFRRSNRDLSHEQIFPSYDLPEERVRKLGEWLDKRSGGVGVVPAIVLLDDFAGSGSSYVREEEGKLVGKLPTLFGRIADGVAWKKIVAFPETSVVVALYVATAQAIDHFGAYANRLREAFGVEIAVQVVQVLEARSRLSVDTIGRFGPLIEKYYDTADETSHTRKGGTDLKYGFAGGGLPVVLHHNTPNNSLYLLWAENSERIRPLFPRFSRHRSEV